MTSAPPGDRRFFSPIIPAHLRLRGLDYSQRPTPFETLFPRAPTWRMRGGLLWPRLRTQPRLHPQAAEPHPRSAGRRGTAALVRTEVLLSRGHDLSQAPNPDGWRWSRQHCWWLCRRSREDQGTSVARRARGQGTLP